MKKPGFPIPPFRLLTQTVRQRRNGIAVPLHLLLLTSAFSLQTSFAQLTFDPANPPTSSTPPTVEYNEYTGTYSHQKGPKSLMMIHVDTSDKPWTSGVTSEATYLTSINSLSQRYYDSSGHQTWVGDKRKDGLTIPRFHLTPVVRLPNAASFYTSDTFYTLFTHAIAAVHALGGDYAVGGRLDPDKFDRIMVNSGSFKAISSQGLAYVGGKYSWPGGAYEHELGHNWGVYHANFWQRPTGSVLPRDVNGSSTEYGDGADIMGSGSTLFTPVFKDTLGFLESSRGEIESIAASGTYRLYAHTQGFVRNATNKVRALKLQLTSGGSPAYLGFRYETGSGVTDGGDNRASRDRNAVQFHWNVGEANFIDTTPDSRKDDDKIDGSIKIGRTYSEPATTQDITNYYGGLHITPITRGSTSAGNVPAGDHYYLDVVINRGSDVPGNNAAPTASFSASTINATAGSSIALTVTASDPDGDALAYDWDFGNGGYNTTNSATQSATYASAGFYLVRCTVSDMKGQTTTAYQWVNVGSQATQPATPTTTISGLHYRTYSGTWSPLPNFDQLQPAASGTCAGFDLAVKPSNDNFAVLYSGHLDVPADDIYQFEILCDDGAKLVIDGQTVINNDGLKTSALNKTGNIALAAGKHSLRLEYFHKDGTETLQVKWWRIGQTQTAIPTANLIQGDWAGNPAPVVSITAPTSSDSYIVNSDITLSADASDAGGIAKVVFFANGGFLAEDTIAPYGTVWPKVSVGSQTIIAIAYDTTGRWTKSAPVTFSVVSPAPTSGIGINFGASDTVRTLYANEAAGAVYAYPNWNNISTTTGSAVVVNDHTGNSSSARLTFQGNDPNNGSRSGIYASNADTSTANGKLMRGGVYRDFDLENGTEPNPYATITDIPYAAYDVYVYFDGLETWDEDAAAQRYVLTPTEGTAPGARFGRNSLTKSDGKGDYSTYDSWTGFREATATALNDPADKLAGNYVVFRNQTASGFKLESTRRDGSTSGTSGRHKRYFSAIQIMQVAPSSPALVLRQTGGTTTVSEAGSRDTVTVALALAPTVDVTVTAIPDAQLNADKTTLTFTPANWQTAQTVTLGAVNDTANEGPHTGTLTLAATGGNYTGLAARTLSASITDDDQPTVNVTASGTAREGVSPVAQSFRFSRSGASSLAGAFTVNFTLSGTADKASDFTLSGASVSYNGTNGTGTVVIPDGSASAVLTLTPTNDSTQEASENAVLTVNAGTGYAVGTNSSATLPIQDDDRVDYFCQYFSTDADYGLSEYPIDLVGKTLTFVPNGSTSYYAASITTGVTAYPNTNYTSHTRLRTNTTDLTGTLDDGWWTVSQPARFYGTAYNTIYVSTEGGVTFDSGSSLWNLGNTTQFRNKRVALYWYALGMGTAAGNTGEIYVGRITTAGQERTVVTYHDYPYGYHASYNGHAKLRGQIEFWDSGKITLTWLQAATTMNANVGLARDAIPYSSQTGSYGPPSDYQESNLSEYPATATSGNVAPAFATVAPLSATVGSTYTYTVAATDPNGDTLTLSAPTKPAWLTMTDNGNGTATLTGTPPASGTSSVTLRVSDGTSTTDQSFSLIVSPVGGNSAPAFTSTPGATPLVSVGGTYTYNITASDPDGQSLTISESERPAWLALTDNGNGTATLTGTAPDTAVASHPVTLLVSDGITSAAQSFTITLNRPPVVTLTAPALAVAQVADRTNALALAATVTDDALPASPGSVTTTWSQVSGPGTTSFASASSAGTSATFSASGTYRLRFTASDGAASSTKDVVVYVETTASLNSGLQGHWKFNEESGSTAADSSGNAKNLTLAGAVTFGTGLEGKAYSGSASDTQYGENTTLAQPAQLTFSAWVNSSVSPGDGGNFRYLLAFRGGTNTRGSLTLPNAKKNLQFRSSHATQGVWDVTGYTVPANEWFHVAVTYDQSNTANNPTVYINGSAVTVTRTTAPAGAVNATDTTRIGGSGGNAAQAWKGLLDEVRLYNRIMNADEIAFLPLSAAPNQAPVVTAALRDPLAAGVTSGTLVGTATDDGLPASPGSLTTTWSQVSGPGAATFGNAAALDSTVNFPAVGIYVLRFTATDGEATVFQDLPVTVTGESFASWISGYSVGGQNGAGDDPDGDGLSNLLEYALGGNPGVADSAIAPVGNVNAGHLQISFRCEDSRTDITYTIQATSDLNGPWVDIARSTGGALTGVLNASGATITDTGSGARTVTVTDAATTATTPRRFLRLKVSQP